MNYPTPIDVHLAPYDFENELIKELEHRSIPIYAQYERLFITPHQLPKPIWSQVTWFDAKITVIQSIKQAATHLKSLNRKWALWSIQDHRRAQLIQDELSSYKCPPLEFLGDIPQTKMGGWTLLDKHHLLSSQHTSSPFPLGEFQFEEDKINPPSRAYLKLWEYFTLTGKYPSKGDCVLDMGSSPGGWTWVLAQLGCQVISVDKASLNPSLYSHPQIKIIQESAFGLSPAEIGHMDWFFSDIICYPERLLNLVRKWHEKGEIKNFVCTIKYQDQTDWKATDDFLTIPGSQITHLHHNKHEVTWSLHLP